MIEKGTDGQLMKPSGKMIHDINYIVMDYVESEELFGFLKKTFEVDGMGESFARFFMHQVLDSLEYIHSEKIVHRDVKLENLLIDRNMNV